MKRIPHFSEQAIGHWCYKDGKPDSDSVVGKLYRKVNGSEVHYDRDCYWEGHGYFIEVAVTPSGGGEKWTKKQWPHGGDSWDVMCGQKRIVADLTELECDMIINAHNATMQPRDCGADTKRLDWLQNLEIHNHPIWTKLPRVINVREAIDAAMRISFSTKSL